MDRRRFIRDAAAISGVAAAAVPLRGKAQAQPVMAVAEGEDWTTLADRAMAKLGGMGAFVKEGQTVLVKPNASFDRSPEQGANTHPEVVKSVVRQCLEAGAAKVMVYDRTLAEERRCWTNSGIEAAVQSLGDKRAYVEVADDKKFVTRTIEWGVVFKKWQFYKEVLEADVYINMPVAKHHKSAKLSLGLKNVLGVIGGNRGKIHWNLDQGIVDLNTMARPKLTVMDATRILLRDGPSGGDLKDVEIKNTVIASADQVAVDAYAAKNLFGIDPAEVGYIKIAAQSGLGTMDLDKVQIIKA